MFGLFKKNVEQQISTPQELENFLLSVIRTSNSGIDVSPSNAMSSPALAAAVRLISSDIGQVPVNIYRHLPNGGREVAKDHRNYGVLVYKPNDYQTSSQFRRDMQINFCLWGNAYARPVRVRDRIVELHPIHPSAVQVKQRDDLSVYYVITNSDGRKTEETDIFHLKDFGSSSYVSDSRVNQNKQAIGLDIAAEKFGALFFKNGAKSSGAWQIDGTLEDEPYERLKASLNATATGDTAHESPLLEQGLKWVSTGFNAKDSQLIELREHQVVEMARIYNVPPHRIQHLKNATFSNIEHQGREYTAGLKHWSCEWEDQLNNFLLSESERGDYSIGLDVDSFSRGDLEARTKFYNDGIQWGYLSPNEARRQEGLADREGGDEYLKPLNMVSTNENLEDETET